MKPPLIAIDGPAGAGKSTTSQAVARILGIPYLDTGALYRAAAWYFSKANVNIKMASAVNKQIDKCQLEFTEGVIGTRIWIDKNEITTQLRSQELTKRVGPVCELPAVREWLIGLQRVWAERGFGVIEGRDIGTVVLPRAGLKIYLTASPEVRAGRRAIELGINDDKQELTKLTNEIAQRDKRDSQRPESPMKPAKDAIILDTSELTFSEQVEKIVCLVGDRFNLKIY
ncbi:MAG: (d)CMP kinase [Candidatus Hatepunaea meridiana]|nr:(d)CMP kinase [Candidatus Hatepunaea meridiana]